MIPVTADDPDHSAREDEPSSEKLDDTLARRYHLTRLIIAAAICLVSLGLVMAWEWSAGLFVTAAAMGGAFDAFMRHGGRWSQAALLPLLVDSTVVGLAGVFGLLPVEAVILPFSYIVVSAFALLHVRAALWFLPYPVLWVVGHLFFVDSGGWSGIDLWIIRAVALLTYVPGLVAILIAASVGLDSAERLDAQLSTSRKQLALTITGAPLILFEYDARGTFTLSEGAGLEKLGLAPGEVVGLSAFDVYADAPDVLVGVERSLTGESFSDVIRLGDLSYQVQYSAQFGEHRNLERVIGVATDVSDRVAAQSALEALVRSKDEFVAIIAHELRTPLTVVVGLSAELRSRHEAFQAAEVEEFIGLIADQSSEVAAIVEDLLVAARADIGKVSVVAEEVDLERAIEGVLKETNYLRRPSTRSVSLEGGTARALADPRRVRQILRNLMTNAYRYGGEEVSIRLGGDAAWSKVVVADSGPGILQSEQEAIFQPFHRAHDTPGRPGSMGLGLSVARQLAELMDGTLVYRHADGRSEFELALPAGRGW